MKIRFMNPNKVRLNKDYQNAINKINGFQFTINHDQQDVLLREGGKYIDCLVRNAKNETNEDSIRTSINLAVALSVYKGPLYLPVFVDWRGRIYPNSTFLNYQGSEISACLLTAEGCEPGGPPPSVKRYRTKLVLNISLLMVLMLMGSTKSPLKLDMIGY